jgi:DNA sulfur modification protein DndD
MRERVQENASSIFRQLTTEEDFAGIRLKEDYSLSVLRSDGLPVDLISAGGNQVLTMSFIGALGASASGEAPLVMDTPLGRLDMGHRHKILKWLTTFTSQVILFVQSGEFEADRDRPILGTSVGRELVIDRGGSAEESTISERVK